MGNIGSTGEDNPGEAKVERAFKQPVFQEGRRFKKLKIRRAFLGFAFRIPFSFNKPVYV